MLPPDPHSHSVAVSLADEHLPDTIPADRPTMLIADGLFAFLSEPVIVGIFRRITEYFRTGELAFNDYGGIGWFSRVAVKLFPQKMFKDVGSQWGYLGFKDAHHPETWSPRLRLVEEASLTNAPEVELFPAWIRIPTRLIGMTRRAPARRGSCATRSSCSPACSCWPPSSTSRVTVRAKQIAGLDHRKISSTAVGSKDG